MIIRRGMNGDHVKRVQDKLTQLHFYRGPIDSSFGGGTESALKRFQQSRAMPVNGIADAATWSALFDGEQPPVSEFAAAPQQQRCLALTGTFETGGQPPECFCGITGDFDGQGISFGVLQWNIGQGSLQPLLAEMFDSHPTVCDSIFHEHNDTLRALGRASKNEQIDFARSIQSRGRVFELW
jgi:peptidoglycan hydrolase-like protein with peptidoglycan-binding domain